MPNIKGGKAYKKTKHGGSEDAVFVEKTDGQMYGRITKNLGGMNLMVFCNDNIERICHIRGALRKRVWMTPGDLVIISLRECTETAKGKERGDIIDKVDSKFHSKLKKDSTINSLLFVNLEKKDSSVPADDTGFVFENENEDNEDNEDNEENEDDKSEESVPKHKNVRSGAMMDDDVDIDTI
jgi:translation initiation factor 1A